MIKAEKISVFRFAHVSVAHIRDGNVISGEVVSTNAAYAM